MRTLRLMMLAALIACDDGGGAESPAPTDGGQADGMTAGGAGGSGEGGQGGLGEGGQGGLGDGGEGGDGGDGGGEGGEGGEGGGVPTICDVSDALLNTSCTGCHNASVQALDLRATGLAERIIGVESELYPGQTLVVPGDPDASFLYQKVIDAQADGTGGVMPPGRVLPAETTEVLRGWIEAGASSECDVEPAPEVEKLSPVDQVVRASMTLRGVRPTPAELDRADELPALIDEWMQTDEFGATIRDMHDELLLLRVTPAGDARASISWKPPLPQDGNRAHTTYLNSQVQEAPLKLIEYVVREDRPYTEILTADYALGNETMEVIWGNDELSPNFGLDCEADEVDGHPGWKRCAWIGAGRGGAGVLSSTFFFIRWTSTRINQNRGRANAISRAFLCHDFLDQPVPLDDADPEIDLADENAIAVAVRDIPSCASCHDALDPIASFLYGYTYIYRPGRADEYPIQFYNPRSAWAPGRTLDNLRDPALFGRPGENLADLGRLITEHPDFATCAVRRTYAYLDQSSQSEVSGALVAQWAQAFTDSGFNMKALIKQMVLSDDFNISHATSEPGADSINGLKKMRPEQAARTFAALTGFEWNTMVGGGRRTYGEVSLLNNALYGYRVLAGGIDGLTVVMPSFTYNGTVAAVFRSLAENAANHVVQTELAQPADARRFLTRVEANMDADAIRAQITDLYWAVLAQRAEDEDIEAALALLAVVRQERGADATQAGWTILLSALFQDARFTHY